MNLLPTNKKRFMTDVFLAGCIIIIAVLGYATGKAGEIADNLITTSQTASIEEPLIHEKTTSTNTQTNMVTIKTNLGNIEIELYPDKAPLAVSNFQKLAGEGFYNGTRFHRVIPNFMIQGGDPLSKDDSKKAQWGTGGPGYMFNDEQNDVKLVRGVLAMANAGPNTNGSQFFIITAAETPWLQGKHTGFGKVITGMDVVEKIGGAKTEQNDRPVTNITIEKVTFN